MSNAYAFPILVLLAALAAAVLLARVIGHKFPASGLGTYAVYDLGNSPVSEAKLWIETAGDMYGNGMLTNESRDEIFRECFSIEPYTGNCKLVTDPQRIVDLVKIHTA